MSNVSSWSTTAASNNSAAPNGAPEGMAPSGVNDVIRENMAANARWYTCLDASIASTGSSNAYVVSTGSGHSALADIGLLVFRANHTNTGASTIAVDGLTAKSIKFNGASVSAGQIQDNFPNLCVYNSDDDSFSLLSVPNVASSIAALTTVTATAAATALLNTNIDNSYSAYDLICIGTLSAADGLSLRVELASSVISTSTYIYASDGLLSGTGAIGAEQAGTGAPVSSVPLAAPGAGSTRPFYLKITIISPSNASRMTPLLIEQISFSTGGDIRRTRLAAANTGTSALTGIQLIPTSGTITCTMNLYPSNV